MSLITDQSRETQFPRFIDVEASSLGPQSYPIQIAWSDAGGDIESWLINPKPVESWTDWDWNAQDVHQIPRSMLTEFGCEPQWVAKRMNQALDGQTVYSDSPGIDGFWLVTLFDAVGIYPAFRIEKSWSLFRELADDQAIQTADARRAWGRTPGRRHQADVDVLHLLETWKILACEA
ncbi:MAG: hypothetical protein ACPW60_10255 [Methylohalobius sp. ZOD2]